MCGLDIDFSGCCSYYFTSANGTFLDATESLGCMRLNLAAAKKTFGLTSSMRLSQTDFDSYSKGIEGGIAGRTSWLL